MALPSPDLDDRRFQDFVDDAKRLVQRRCPEWTDHNVSDPGVTLIEAFATIADQLVYRFNRVPERHHLALLELIGVRLFPASAARVDVTFWLSAPQRERVVVREATEVATRRVPGEAPVVFSIARELVMPAVELAEIRSIHADGTVRDHRESLSTSRSVSCFQPTPALGDALHIGLSNAAPSCAVALRLECHVDGIGVDPDAPPLLWEAWSGDNWVRCDVDRDETGGLNRSGDVVLHLPASHTAHLINGLRAGWLRARVVEPPHGRTAYTTTPTLDSAHAFVIGGTVEAVHAELIRDEVIGTAEGVPSEWFTVSRTPVLDPGDEVVVEVGGPDGWTPWQRVPDFSSSEPTDRHFILDASTGTVEFGPEVRWPDYSKVQHGAVPPVGAPVRVRSYLTGGGATGNVNAHALQVLRSSIPYVSRVENRRPARGGRDAEDVANARLRGALMLRSRGRCVTAEDYEHTAREAAPELARVRCVPAGADDPSAVRLLVVPALPSESERMPFDSLRPAEETLAKVAHAVDRRRVLGARVVVEPPSYQGLTVVARVRPRPGVSGERVQQDCLAALYRFLGPMGGGPDGTGWPFGRPVQYGEIFAVLQQLADVNMVEDVRLFPADPVTGSRGEPVQRLEVAPHALVFSYDHQVRVVA
jgi:predicted phage baseplate assembly protein